MLHNEVEVGAEVMSILRGAEERAEKQKAANPPQPEEPGLPSFPEIAWRGMFATYRDIVKDTTEASDVTHFAALWATCGVRLGRSIYMTAGDAVYPNVYICVFGPTGDKKTTGERKPRALGLLDNVHVLSVGSPEGIAEAMKPDEESGESRSTALFYIEEFSSLLSRAQWKNSTILQFLVEAYDCPHEYKLTYKKDNKVMIVEPTPTILTGTTSDWFWKNARAEDFHGGFANRFVFLTGTKKAPMPNPDEPDHDKVRSLRESIMGLGQQYRGSVRFSKDAERAWTAFYLAFEGQERAGLVAAALKRIHTSIRKLAMVYAATEGTLPVITYDQIRAAIAVGKYAADCTKALIEERGAGRPEAELERRFLEFIGKHPGARKRYMQQTLSKYAGSCEVFNKVMINLVRAGHIQIEDGKVYLER